MEQDFVASGGDQIPSNRIKWFEQHDQNNQMQIRSSPLIYEVDSSSEVSNVADNNAPIPPAGDMHSFHRTEELGDSSYVYKFVAINQTSANNSSGRDVDEAIKHSVTKPATDASIDLATAIFQSTAFHPAVNEVFLELSDNNNDKEINSITTQNQDCFLNSLNMDIRGMVGNPLIILEPVEDEFVTQNDIRTSDLPQYETPNTPNIVPMNALSQDLQEINNDLLRPVSASSPSTKAFLRISMEPTLSIEVHQPGKITAATAVSQGQGLTLVPGLSAKKSILEGPPAPKNPHQDPVEMRMRQPSDRVTRRVVT